MSHLVENCLIKVFGLPFASTSAFIQFHFNYAYFYHYGFLPVIGFGNPNKIFATNKV
jgi:hypothetical protein